MPSKEIIKMIDITGRLRYNAIRDFAREKSRQEFEEQFEHPLLVNAALCEGSMGEQQGKDMTMRFDLSSLNAPENQSNESDSDPGELQRSVYPFFKIPTTPSDPVNYTIGRVQGNDFMMIDYTISRQHARIQICPDSVYTIMDCRSMNGTMLNEQPLPPEEPQPLVAGNKVRFGRFQFFFLAPTLLYILLRQGGNK